MVILRFFLGLVSGIFGGLGMGGGTLLIPLLTIFLGLDQKVAQGINLLSFLVMAIISISIHSKNGYIYTKGLIYLILGGITFALAGAFIAVSLPSRVLKVLFGAFLCALALFETIKVFKRDKK